MDDITSILKIKKEMVKRTIQSGSKIFVETKNNPKGKSLEGTKQIVL